MNVKRLSIALLTLVCVGCGGDDGSGSDTDAGDVGTDADASNAAPTAVADANTTKATPGTTITVDARESSDPDDDDLAFSWTLTASPGSSTASLDTSTGPQASFTPATPGAYTVRVDVSDGEASASSSLDITIFGKPTADAGSDQTGQVGEAVEFDGSGSGSPGGSPLDYTWRFVTKPDTSQLDLSGESGAVATFTPDVAGTYVAELEVSNDLQSATDRVNAEVSGEDGTLAGAVFAAPDGDDENPGTESAPVRTIVRALEIVRSNDSVSRIVLAAGDYSVGSPDFSIEDDLDIAGPNDASSTPTISGSGPLFSANAGAYLTLVNVDVETDDTAFSVGPSSSLSLNRVGCTASTCIRAGEFFGQNGGGVEVIDSVLTGANSSAAGISAVSPDDVTVRGTTITGFETVGITLTNGPMTVRNSVIESNDIGIQSLDSETDKPTLVVDTEFQANATGLQFESTENATLDNATIRESSSVGIDINAGALVVENSTIQNGGGHGVVVDGNSVFTMRNTGVVGFDQSGLRVVGPDARVDLGTQGGSSADNELYNNSQAQLLDARPDAATGRITLNGTRLGTGMVVTLPPAGTYSGPGFDDYGIQIVNDNEVEVY